MGERNPSQTTKFWNQGRRHRKRENCLGRILELKDCPNRQKIEAKIIIGRRTMKNKPDNERTLSKKKRSAESKEVKSSQSLHS